MEEVEAKSEDPRKELIKSTIPTRNYRIARCRHLSLCIFLKANMNNADRALVRGKMRAKDDNAFMF